MPFYPRRNWRNCFRNWVLPKALHARLYHSSMIYKTINSNDHVTFPPSWWNYQEIFSHPKRETILLMALSIRSMATLYCGGINPHLIRRIGGFISANLFEHLLRRRRCCCDTTAKKPPLDVLSRAFGPLAVACTFCAPEKNLFLDLNRFNSTEIRRRT